MLKSLYEKAKEFVLANKKLLALAALAAAAAVLLLK